MVDGVEVSVMACFINSCQCQPIHPSLVLEGQSRVYHSWCIVASPISLSVLACFVKCGHCVRRSESGMALGMMSLQSTHLTLLFLFHITCFSFFVHNQLCGLLSKCQLTACQPHSLRRERWGLSRYNLKPGRVE